MQLPRTHSNQLIVERNSRGVTTQQSKSTGEGSRERELYGMICSIVMVMDMDSLLWDGCWWWCNRNTSTTIQQPTASLCFGTNTKTKLLLHALQFIASQCVVNGPTEQLKDLQLQVLMYWTVSVGFGVDGPIWMSLIMLMAMTKSWLPSSCRGICSLCQIIWSDFLLQATLYLLLSLSSYYFPTK